tara:strand:- start:173 stop:796 length:624 start_codon:yes stop_codon:yes gene_type:complete
MTVRVNKDAFNVREKLSELDYGHVPYEKMPLGSCIGSAFYQSSLTTTTVLSMTNSGTDGYAIDPAFTYYKRNPNSILYVEYRYNVGDPEGYWRENILFDHTQENAYTSGTVISNSGSGVQTASNANSLIESQKATGVITGYVAGAASASGVNPIDFFYIPRSLSGFIHHPSNFVSICLTLGPVTNNTLNIRDDNYASPRALVMEFLQ